MSSNNFLNINICISDVSIKDFLKEFNNYEISLDYFWDNSLDYERYKKQGYTEKEILEELEIELEERDEEYSFHGSYEKFLKFQEKYDCWDWDYVDLSFIDELKIDIVNKIIYIKYIKINLN